jgi:alpha-L-rhamnosidase
MSPTQYIARLVAFLAFAVAAAAIEVRDLRCEHLVEPVGIDVAHPRLSWEMRGEGRGSRGERQTAYQIEVMSGGGVCWDSGKVSSDRSVAVRYAGRPLVSVSRYDWRVRVWDGRDHASAWSASASFMTGKLNSDDWRGKWIGVPDERPDNTLGFAVESRAADEAQWVQVDLGQPVPIERVVLHPMHHDDPAAGGWIKGYAFPLRFRLETSLAADFRESLSLADRTQDDFPNPGWAQVSFDGGGMTGRYVRLTATKIWHRGPGLPHACTLGEMQVFSAGRNAAEGAPVAASSSVEGYGWARSQLTDGRALCPAEDSASAPTRENPHGAICLRREVDVAKPVTHAAVFFCGLGFSELAIDGRKVGDYVIGPGFTTYDKRVQYLGFDVTDRFRVPGRKTLDVILADGWYGLERDPWVHQFENRAYVDRPKLLLDLHLRHEDGTETVISSDENWKWSEGEIVRSWIAQEDIDLRRTARNWQPVTLVSGPAGALVRQREPFNRIVEEFQPVAMTFDAEKRTCVWDFGREINGWVRFRAAGPSGTELKIITIPTEPRPRTSRFVLAGVGEKETYEPRFFHAGMRRVEVSGLVVAPETNDLVGCQVSSMYTPSGGFECSDELQNWLNDSVRRTVAAYTTFLPNDPVREWKAWTQDIENMFRSAVYLFDSRAMYERWQYDLLDGQRADGSLPNIAPGPFFDDYNSPWWGGCAVWLPWHWYLYYGDDTLLRDSYDAIKRYVDYLGRVSKDGLQDWGLADWLPVEETPRPIINTPAHFLYAQIVSRAADLLGRPDDARHYGEVARSVRDAFNTAFLDPATGIYGQPGWTVRSGNWTPPVPLERTHEVWWTGDRPCTQAGQALPLALGMVPEESRAAVERALLREIAAHSNRVSTGFVSTPYLLEVLADLAPEIGWAMTSARGYPSWHGMTQDSGNDLMKETWAGGQALMPSLGGNIASWHMEALAGIRPDPTGPGFKKIIIKPATIGDLIWVKAHHDSPYGRITVAWKRDAGKLTLDVTIPVNTTATVYVPGSDVESDGGRQLRVENGATVFAIESGSYQFKSNGSEIRPLESPRMNTKRNHG